MWWALLVAALSVAPACTSSCNNATTECHAGLPHVAGKISFFFELARRFARCGLEGKAAGATGLLHAHVRHISLAYFARWGMFSSLLMFFLGGKATTRSSRPATLWLWKPAMLCRCAESTPEACASQFKCARPWDMRNALSSFAFVTNLPVAASIRGMPLSAHVRLMV
eukprot:m.763068 g.763068  ORF g.763068 m.763068 type:complete len:168 (-) comp59055_c0_seq1:3215-3718(-)